MGEVDSLGGGAGGVNSESSNVSFSDRDTPTEGKEASGKEPDFSPSNTYLETSFEVGQQTRNGGEGQESVAGKVPPPTLPKPKIAEAVAPAGDTSLTNGNTTLDRKVRNITQV